MCTSHPLLPQQFSVKVSHLELYNGKARDLLSDGQGMGGEVGGFGRGGGAAREPASRDWGSREEGGFVGEGASSLAFIQPLGRCF